MSNNDTNTPTSTGGGATDEPTVTKEYFLALTPATFEALPPKQRQAVVEWLLRTPHNLNGRPQSTQSTKEQK